MSASTVIFLVLVYLAAGVGVTYLLAKHGAFRRWSDDMGIGATALAMIVFWPGLAALSGVTSLGKWLKAAERKS